MRRSEFRRKIAAIDKQRAVLKKAKKDLLAEFKPYVITDETLFEVELAHALHKYFLVQFNCDFPFIIASYFRYNVINIANGRLNVEFNRRLIYVKRGPLINLQINLTEKCTTEVLPANMPLLYYDVKDFIIRVLMPHYDPFYSYLDMKNRLYTCTPILATKQAVRLILFVYKKRVHPICIVQFDVLKEICKMSLEIKLEDYE